MGMPTTTTSAAPPLSARAHIHCGVARPKTRSQWCILLLLPVAKAPCDPLCPSVDASVATRRTRRTMMTTTTPTTIWTMIVVVATMNSSWRHENNQYLYATTTTSIIMPLLPPTIIACTDGTFLEFHSVAVPSIAWPLLCYGRRSFHWPWQWCGTRTNSSIMGAYVCVCVCQ